VTPEGAAAAFRTRLWEFIRRYHRHEVEYDATLPDEPSLFVGNHGFGGVFDLNVISLSRAIHTEVSRPITYLVHQIAWTTGMGWFVEPFGCKPASAENAATAFASGHHVVVFPGGDVDAGKSFTRRNRVIFGGRSGFARLAIEHGVPIIPVVTAGAGESLLVLSDGQPLAKALGLPASLRIKALPVSLSIPWGLNVGLVGMVPYFPLPSKLRTVVMEPLWAEDDEEPTDFAKRVESAMQERLDALVANRTWLIG
jgi:1-acyl-sn-glycerol-3-phosphate acyltransferase